jgi:hypothetical protein
VEEEAAWVPMTDKAEGEKKKKKKKKRRLFRL